MFSLMSYQTFKSNGKKSWTNWKNWQIWLQAMIIKEFSFLFLKEFILDWRKKSYEICQVDKNVFIERKSWKPNELVAAKEGK